MVQTLQPERVITRDDTAPYDNAIDEVVAIALASISPTFRSLQNDSGEVLRQGLVEIAPAAVETFAPQISEIAAEEYMNLRVLSGPVLPAHRPVVARAPERQRVISLVGWALDPVFTPQHDTKQAFSLLAGGLTRMLLDQQRQTMIDNLVDDAIDGAVGYQRVPRAGCCAFCAMQASRYAAYNTRRSAGQVIGTGTPLENWKPGTAGRAPLGRRPRGEQGMNEAFHDYCRCRVVPVYRSTAVQMEDEAEGWYEAYQEAENAVDEDLVLRVRATNTGGRISSRRYYIQKSTGLTIASTYRPNLIIAEMRRQLGTN